MNATATVFRLGDDAADKQYRSILSFDTSSLPDNAVITKVTLKIKYQGTVGTNPFTTHSALYVDIRRDAFSGNNALQPSDFEAAANKNIVGIIPNAPASGWYSRIWTSSIFPYINKAGLTQFRLRFQKDDNNDNGADYLNLFSGNSATTSRPQLIVTYSIPPNISCGQTITEDTILDADLACPPDTEYAIVIGASNITLDLGGHVISGHAPGTGVFSIGHEGITIRNGTIEGFNAGVFIIETRLVTMENLTVRNLDISDPNHFIFGIQILGSQNVVVRDSLFEFLTVPHKSAVEIFDSYVDVSNIEVLSGGAGVGFSFAGGVCDPVNSPSNGTVRNSRFSDIYVAGIWIACSSSALIEGNDFSGCPVCLLGIQGDSPFEGAVTHLAIKDNNIHGTKIGIEFRGILNSNISNNRVYDNQIWGIAMRQSMGCLAPEPGWECFYSTANVIADNKTWGNGMDLYHYEESLGNIWERNTCETKQGVEIPECIPPAGLPINTGTFGASIYEAFLPLWLQVLNK